MLRATLKALHRGGKSRGYLLKDPSLMGSFANGKTTLKRVGAQTMKTSGWRRAGRPGAQNQYDHAWPLLTHDDLGEGNQANDTRHLMLSYYMPKRNKGTPPWFRGADTYSPLYCEQGRYEYQRYLMISRFPAMYKKHFKMFLNNIHIAGKRQSHIPQEALHWLLRMIVDNFNPQHIHYVAAMTTLMAAKEYDMARDAWKVMERQQTIPDDKCITCYLELCCLAKEKTWALQCWNRYCTEKKFLKHGEPDPKPVSRVPFSLTRDELLYLPKWKKHFDHDPNLDVVDLNRFNTTRNIYLKMALAMLATGEIDLFRTFYGKLEEAMLTTPTPVPEPPNPHLVQRPLWGPHERQEAMPDSPWRPENSERFEVLGPSQSEICQLSPRFFSNEQFLVYSVCEVIRILMMGKEVVVGGSSQLEFCEEMLSRLKTKLGSKYSAMATEPLFTAVLQLHREFGGLGGDDVKAMMHKLLEEKAQMSPSSSAAAVASSFVEVPHAAMYLEVLKGYAAQSDVVDIATQKRRDDFDPHRIMRGVAETVKEMTTPTFVWAADLHLAIVECLVNCGTMKANEYFVKNVLRQFKWDCRFLVALYKEYSRHDDVEMWAELTKRAMVWTARYDVKVSDELKDAIEADYDTIKVQVRTFKELAVFQFRDVEEKRIAKDPVNQLPNPWTDYVSHALPFPDRDTGYPDEYGDIGQWRVPDLATGKLGPQFYSPPMEGEAQRGYTSEWRDPKNLMQPPALPSPWDRKYKQYARGTGPSYDQVYAGPYPEVFPGRYNWRQKTRWDFHEVEKQGKYRIAGPF